MPLPTLQPLTMPAGTSTSRGADVPDRTSVKGEDGASFAKEVLAEDSAGTGSQILAEDAVPDPSLPSDPDGNDPDDPLLAFLSGLSNGPGSEANQDAIETELPRWLRTALRTVPQTSDGASVAGIHASPSGSPAKPGQGPDVSAVTSLLPRSETASTTLPLQTVPVPEEDAATKGAQIAAVQSHPATATVSVALSAGLQPDPKMDAARRTGRGGDLGIALPPSSHSGQKLEIVTSARTMLPDTAAVAPASFDRRSVTPPSAAVPDPAAPAVEGPDAAARTEPVSTFSDRPVPLTALRPALAEQIARLDRSADGPDADGVRVDRSARTADIELAPAELGRLRITLQSTERGLHLSIAVERPEMLETVRRHLDGLHRALLSEGVSLDSVDIGSGRNDRSGDRPARPNAPPDANADASLAARPDDPQAPPPARSGLRGHLDLSL